MIAAEVIRDLTPNALELGFLQDVVKLHEVCVSHCGKVTGKTESILQFRFTSSVPVSVLRTKQILFVSINLHHRKYL
jgi:hypothetical protein